MNSKFSTFISSFNQATKGKQFEVFVKWFLENDPVWKSEVDKFPKVNVFCEPQLGKRDLYPTLSTKSSGNEVRLMMDLITWADGSESMLEIAEICDVPIWELYPIVKNLSEHKLLNLFDEPVNF